MLSSSEIQGVFAIMPTPAKDGASELGALNTVDIDEVERVTNALISDGVEGIIALGTTGECATLSQQDYDSFAECLLEVVGRRVPVLVGTTALSGHEVVRRMQLIRKLGADGTLLGLPMWQPLSLDGAVNFYAGLSQMFPELAIMAYANERAFRFAFTNDFWSGIIHKAPTVTSAKYSRPKDLKSLLSVVQGRINIVPNEMTISHFYSDSPETTTACWATAASMGPRPVIELMNAVRRNDLPEIERLSNVLAWANETVKPIIGDKELFGMYTVQLEKTRINAAGYCNSGPLRPPYTEIPENVRIAAIECGRRWALLNAHAKDGISIPPHVAN
jgi:dihydrodipicolinate synthase/N-acetylneuraminate lyase